MMGSSIKEKKNKVWIAIVVGVVFYFLFQMISFPGLTAEGQKAIDELNGAEYDRKTISVSVARPREERPRNNGYNSRRY